MVGRQGFKEASGKEKKAIAFVSATELTAGILQRDIRAISRALSRIENQDPEVREIIRNLYPLAGQSLVVGITGSPGCGKSTLVDQLARLYRASGKRVGILAVDPSSPFSGGAILGDRVRMQSLATDPGVFIRSMATRGKMGGLSAAVHDALIVLEAAGYEVLLVETVGVGQDEVDIVKTAQVNLVVLVPGMGDEIQTLKAGVMEIADLFVINKADREGVLRVERELQALVSMKSRPDGWQPPILKTIATRGEGIEQLVQAIEEYRTFRARSPQNGLRERQFFREKLLEMAADQLLQHLLSSISEESLEQAAEQLRTRQADPYTLVEGLLKEARSKGREA